MSAESEEKMRDLAIWYYENRNRIPKENLGKHIDFFNKAMSAALEVIAMQMKDIQILEQRRPHARLWLPASVKLDDNETMKLR